MTNIYNLFKFIEDKEGKKPDSGKAFKLKLTYAPEKLTPEDLKVDGNLYLDLANLKSIPKGLQVAGNLTLYSLKSSDVLDGLRVGGNLTLNAANLKSIPKGLQVAGNLTLHNLKSSDVLDGLRVRGSLTLNLGEKLSLPSTLQVGGTINLGYSEIISISNDLKINSSLLLENASINSLPDNLKVPGNLNLDKAKPLKTLPDNLQVGGNLYLRDSSIEAIPNNLKVGGNLFLNRTKVTSFPESLEVGGIMDITGILKIKPEDIPESLRSKIKWGGGTWDDFNRYTNLPEIDVPTMGTVKGAKIDFAENKELIFKYDTGIQKFIEESRPEKIEAYAAYTPEFGSVTISYVLVIQLPGIPSPFIINTKDYTIKHKSKTLKLNTFASDITGRGVDAALSRLIPGYSKQEIPKHLQNEKGKLLRLSQIVDKEEQPVSMNLGNKRREGLGVKGQYKDYALSFSPDTQNIVVRVGRKLNIEWKDFIAYRHNGFGDVNYVIRGENPDGEAYYLNKQGSGQGSTVKLYNKEFKQV